jgi:hypothetical protein
MTEMQKREEAQQAAQKAEKRAEELLIALNTLGTENFIFSIISKVLLDDCLTREREWICAAANNKRQLIEKVSMSNENNDKNEEQQTVENQFTSERRTSRLMFPKYPIAVLVFTYARPQYLCRCLDSIFKYKYLQTLP